MSTPRSPDWLLALALAACLGPAGAAGAAPDPSLAQRERIGRERQAIDREAQQAQQTCALRFAVTDCVDRAKARRRERMRPLDLELARLDEAWRKQRAAQRLAQIRQPQSAQRQVPPEVAVRARRELSEPLASAPTLAAPGARRKADAALADVEASQRATAAARRAEQAQSHRAVVEEKNRQRAAQREPARPLPLPPASGASR